MTRLEKLFKDQKGVCPWCAYTMLLGWYSKDIRDIDVAATIDHLEPKHYRNNYRNGNGPRHTVAAHRLCNNARGHNPSISLETIKVVEKSVIQFGLTKNPAMATAILERVLPIVRATLQLPTHYPLDADSKMVAKYREVCQRLKT